MASIQIVPAYGRDYTSKQKAQADFDADKDFRILDVSNKYNGKYINKSQIVGEYDEVWVRYNNLQRKAKLSVE